MPPDAEAFRIEAVNLEAGIVLALVDVSGTEGPRDSLDTVEIPKLERGDVTLNDLSVEEEIRLGVTAVKVMNEFGKFDEVNEFNEEEEVNVACGVNGANEVEEVNNEKVVALSLDVVLK